MYSLPRLLQSKVSQTTLLASSHLSTSSALQAKVLSSMGSALPSIIVMQVKVLD